eukprot:1817351-Alexandrium_andersonii.AAC.1
MATMFTIGRLRLAGVARWFMGGPCRVLASAESVTAFITECGVATEGGTTEIAKMSRTPSIRNAIAVAP